MKRTVKQTVHDGWKILKEDICQARWAIVALALYFLFFKYILHSMCPMVLATGYPCPGCGMTRAAFCVLRLDFAAHGKPIRLFSRSSCLRRYSAGTGT